MATEPEGNDPALKGNDAQRGNHTVRNEYAVRAAAAVDRLVRGPDRDKKLARAFGISVRMAKYLRRGEHWTTGRLAQASAIFGAAFDQLLAVPSTAQILDRLDELDIEREALRKLLGGGERDE